MAAATKNLRAVVTGAGSGIGRAIAARLAAIGADVCLIGRTPAKLDSVRTDLSHMKVKVHALPCDLDKEDDVLALRPHIERLFPALDVLVHSAGTIHPAPLASVTAAELDAHYRVNVRAPVLLTQALLPLIASARGQIVFINSSLGIRTKENCGAYAASKHALKAIADTLRMELNPRGIRVLTAYPGNTATQMQAQLCRDAGKPFDAERMLQPDDVAAAVVQALLLPRTAEVTDLHIRPAEKSA